MALIATGVPRLDLVLGGGLPESYLVTIAGRPGTGKTILVQQIAATYASQGGKVLYVTGLSEAHVNIIAQLRGFSFLDPALLGDRIKLVNVMPLAREGLGSVTSALVRTISDEKVSMLIFDGFQSLRDIAGSESEIRSYLYELAGTLSAVKATSLIISERDPSDARGMSELLVADGVIGLGVGWTGKSVQRTIEVAKMRGLPAIKGPHTLALSANGMEVYPRPESFHGEPTWALADERASLGNAQIDQLLHGGVPRTGAILLAGQPGTGKTLLGLSFLAAGVRQGEPGIYASVGETPDELRARARSLQLDLVGPGEEGLVHFVHNSAANLEADCLAWNLWELAERTKARRVVLDGVASLAHALSGDRLPGFLAAVSSHLRALGATVCFGLDVSDAGLPFGEAVLPYAGAAGSILALRLDEKGNRLRYRMAVVKMGGSDHDRGIHEYSIGATGIALLS